MKNTLLLTTAFTLLMPALSHAGVEQDLSSGGVIESRASESELGSEIDMIGKDFNLKSVQEAFDTAPDTANVKVYDYAINKTFAVRLRVNMATMIVLPEWEEIKAFSLADDLYFSVTNFDNDGMRNKLVLQSNIGGVDSNLIVVGASGRIYNFYLRADPTDSKVVPHFSVYIKGAAPNGFITQKLKEKETEDIAKSINYGAAATAPLDPAALEKAKADYLNSLQDKDDVNLDYTVSGDFEIAPRAVYSRHGWTFFDFRETTPSDRLPVPFKVVDGYDAVVNYRMEEGFLVVETVSKEGWTLRNGDKTICVRPE